MNLNSVIQLHAAGHLDAAEQGYRSLIAQDMGGDIARRNLALICLTDNRLDEAVELLSAAIELNGNDPETYLNLGCAFKGKGDVGRAVDCWRRAIAIKPDYPEAFLNIGVALSESGDLAGAAESYLEAIRIRPNYAEAYYNLANICMARGQRAEAIDNYQKALQSKPDYADAYLNLGNAFGGSPGQALAYYRKAVEVNPRYAPGYVNIGNALSAEGKLQEALSYYETAVQLAPGYWRGHNNLGVALRELRRLDEALACFTRALQCNPRSPDALINLGLVSKDLGKLDEAIVYYNKALELDPSNAGAISHLGNALADAGRLDEAFASYQRSLKIKTEGLDAGSVVRRLGELLYESERIPVIYQSSDEVESCRRRFADSLQEAEQLIAKQERPFSEQELGILRHVLFTTTNFYLCYQQFNDRDLAASYAKIAGKILEPDLQLPQLSKPVFPGGQLSRPIRLGLASEYLKNHNGAYWAYGWLSNLPKDDYEFFFYSLNGTTDHVTERFASLGTFRWLPFRAENYRNSLHVIRADNLDVLILPDVGMTASSKIISLARLAPVQCVGWGHPVTTGSPNMDYFLSSELMEPENGQEHYSERLVRLPKIGVYLNDPTLAADEESAADLGIPDNRVVFGSLQMLFKYLPQYDYVFPAIARAVPNAFFIFAASDSPAVTEKFKGRLKGAFSKAGIDFDQHVKIMPRLPFPQYKQLLSRLDICLDSLGWTGGITTMHCLAMNCPVLTMPGEFMRGRLTYAMLKMIDVCELIADSVDSYINLAVALASNAGLRSEIVEKIKRKKSQLFYDTECIDYLDTFLKSCVQERSAQLDGSPEDYRPEVGSTAPSGSHVAPQPVRSGQTDIDAAGHYNAGLSFHRAGKFEDAIACYEKALRLSPAEGQIHNDIGMAFYSLGKIEEAIASFVRACELNPGNPAYYLNWGNACCASGKPYEGIAHFKRALELSPDYCDAHYNLGNTFRMLGKWKEAVESYKRVIGLNPRYVNAYLNMGNTLQERGLTEQAVECYKNILEFQPDLAPVYLNLGVCSYALGRWDQAVSYYRRSLELKPDYVDAHANLGLVLSAQGAREEAIASCRRAIELMPEHAGAHINLGVAYLGLKKYDDAAGVFRRVLEIEPHNVTALNNLGLALKGQKKLEDAAFAFQEALKCKVDFPDAYNGLADTLAEQDKINEAVSSYQKAFEFKCADLPAGSVARKLGRLLNELHRLPVIYMNKEEVDKAREHYQSCLMEAAEMVSGRALVLSDEERRVLKGVLFGITNFYLAYQQKNDKDLQTNYANLATEILRGEIEGYLKLEQRSCSNEKIRLGVASEYILAHNGVVWSHGWLSNLPKSDYDIFVYSLGGARDRVTEEFSALGTYRWLPFGQDSYLNAFEAIKRDKLDILFFPDVGMSIASKIISLARLAPIQCVGWGHPMTTGSANMDFYLSGELMETDQSDAHYSERLVRLPNVGLYLEPPERPQPAQRADFGIPDNRTVFGNVQSLFKNLPQYDFVYPAIAKELPDALFVFIGSESDRVTARFRERMNTCFKAGGLDARKHVLILPRLTFSRFMQLLPLLDLNLDSIGWNGGMTTMRSLAVDCPVLTVPGEFMRGRHSYAMLKTIGMEKLIAYSLDDYVARAVSMTADRRMLKGISVEVNKKKRKLFKDSSCVQFLDSFWKAEVSKIRRG